jgi:hypothetical protein
MKKIKLITFLLISAVILNVASFQRILNPDEYSRNENLRMSIQDITLNTPENTTYTEPMNGYYLATYGFENELDGTSGTDIKFVGKNTDQGTSYIKVIPELGGHKNVLEAYDGSTVGFNSIYHYFDTQTSGTFEWWWRITSSRGANIYLFGSTGYGPQIGMNNGYFTVEGSSIQNILAYSTNTWYHIRLDFECDSGGYMGLSADTMRIFINGVEYGPFNFRFNQDAADLNRVMFYNGRYAYSGYHIYYDAWGESWDPNYNIGDNLDEGLLLSYQNSISLDWQGYSLDGQATKTILGNTVFPMLDDGLHTIQVFGEDSSGKIYSSDARLFTVETEPPSIFITSPTSSALFGVKAPDFELNIIELNLVSTWYSLDGGITKIFFTGFTGTIDQSEWDKIGDMSVTITFFADDIVGNEVYVDITIVKSFVSDLINCLAKIQELKTEDLTIEALNYLNQAENKINLAIEKYNANLGVTSLYQLKDVIGFLLDAEGEGVSLKLS